MADAAQTLEQNVTYLRRLAQAGRAGPPLGGLLMAAFGLYIGLGAAGMWLGAPGVFGGVPFLAGFLAFAAIACGGADVSQRRVIVAAGASLAAMAAVWAFYRAGLQMTRAAVQADPEAWRETMPYMFWQIFNAVPPLLALSLLGVAAYILIRLRRHPAAMAPGNVVAGALWSGAMLAMAGMIVALLMLRLTLNARFGETAAMAGGATDTALNAARGAAAIALSGAVPALFWMIWALAWWVWGLASGRRWALLVAAGSAGVAVWYGLTMAVYPTSVAGLLLLAFLPGLVLIREARATGRPGGEAVSP